ncbi:hypothetical protein NUW54_g5663 [Trametes sanguinea]|uniref:Uncharacterized protein n=1 Tax=Trametes sanguinea TaxID=158606 RepID=A0ACC1PVH4_9APHY|nr:hypothetical protein NUW54_g5663 [Trametes sanguinea]
MLRQHILLTGQLGGAKKERTSRTGYILDYDPSPLTPDELATLRVRLSKESLNRLVELAHKEATQIAKQLLGIPSPSLPFTHIPLRPPPTRRRRKRKQSSASESADAAEDSDPEECDDANTNDDDDDEDTEDEDPLMDPRTAEGSCAPAAGPHGIPDAQDIARMAEQTADAAHYAARYSALAEDFEDTLRELDEIEEETILVAAEPNPTDMCYVPATFGPPPPPPKDVTPSAPTQPSALVSTILGLGDMVSIQGMLDTRKAHQSGTGTWSERIVQTDPKFAISRIDKPDSKMSVREASHHVRVAQDLAPSVPKRRKTAREQRWMDAVQNVRTVVSDNVVPNLMSKNVTSLNPLRPGTFLVMKSAKRTYIGEVLDVYKMISRRHGSVDVATSVSGLSYLSLRVYLPLTIDDSAASGDDTRSSDEEDTNDVLHFSCRPRNSTVEIHTHAPVDHLLYNLGIEARQSGGQRHLLVLKPYAASRWRALTRKKVQKLFIKIPARGKVAPKPDELEDHKSVT